MRFETPVEQTPIQLQIGQFAYELYGLTDDGIWSVSEAMRAC
jgi:hypothetical protein